MGLIRKTLSVTTLGIIPFRSRKDRLRTAEHERKAARGALAAQRKEHLEVAARLTAAEARVEAAELLALQESGRANRANRKLSDRRAERRRALAGKAAEQLEVAKVAGARAQSSVREETTQLSRRAQRRWAKAQKELAKREKAAKRSARQLRKDAKRTAAQARDQAKDTATRLADTGREVATDLRDEVQEKVSALR